MCRIRKRNKIKCIVDNFTGLACNSKRFWKKKNKINHATANALHIIRTHKEHHLRIRKLSISIWKSVSSLCFWVIFVLCFFLLTLFRSTSSTFRFLFFLFCFHLPIWSYLFVEREIVQTKVAMHALNASERCLTRTVNTNHVIMFFF